MNRHRVFISSRAMRQIERVSAWWREHRDKAPGAFDEDLDAAFAILRTNPHSGTLVRARRIQVRSLWLERIGHFVYYREHDNGSVEILAIGTRRAAHVRSCDLHLEDPSPFRLQT